MSASPMRPVASSAVIVSASVSPLVKASGGWQTKQIRFTWSFAETVVWVVVVAASVTCSDVLGALTQVLNESWITCSTDRWLVFATLLWVFLLICHTGPAVAKSQ